jgi:hypothetical protein
MIKNTFKFPGDQEMVELYKSYLSSSKCFFESQVLICVMRKLGMSKKYMMEDILAKKDHDRVLIKYSKKHYIDAEFFQRSSKDEGEANSYKVVLDALEFLNKELKKNPSISASDFPICFLEAFNM